MARARNTDPITSHEAAESVGEPSETQAYVLRALRKPRTDSQLIEAYNALARAPRASESGIRTRRAELVAMGRVSDSGKREKTASGRWSIVWERTER
jgi:hypothetical protein